MNKSHIHSLLDRLARRPLSTGPLSSSYVRLGLVTLILTTIYWSYLGAKVQSHNADQLVSSLLFESSATFHGALFPAAHTFVLKWPIFALIGVFGNTSNALYTLTILISLITVLSTAYVLYRIDKRPERFGTWLLALSSILLAIPAQSHTGSLLPVNFAMITTRNIEYLVYVAAIACMIQSHVRANTRLRTISIVLMGLLALSDKLFLYIVLGTGVCMAVYYIAIKHTVMRAMCIQLLGVGVVSAIISVVGISLINSMNITYIADSAAMGPFHMTSNAKQLALGLFHTFTGIATVTGANPVFDINVIKDMPAALPGRLMGAPFITYTINTAILALGIYSCVKIIRHIHKRREAHTLPEAFVLSSILSVSAIVACTLFILTDHYYAADARYVSMAFFAIIVGAAAYSRRYPLPDRHIRTLIGSMLVLSCMAGCMNAWHSADIQDSAFHSVAERNAKIVSIIQKHNTHILLADYWRAVPMHALAGNTVIASPLESCLERRQVLSSSQWQPHIGDKERYAYLLTFDTPLPTQPSCTMEEVIARYGKPSDTVIVSGTNEHPREILLLYGTRKLVESPPSRPASNTVTQQAPQPTPSVISCSTGTTMLAVAAHQDDDILFMSPDLQRHITAGGCLRVMYMTAGDAGLGLDYTAAREAGVRAGYAHLLGISHEPSSWTSRRLDLTPTTTVTAYSPLEYEKLSLIFLRLPDGNINGHGFHATGYQSLERLFMGYVGELSAIDQSSTYTYAAIIDSLKQIVRIYQPQVVSTHAHYDTGAQYHDHSDHIYTGALVRNALEGSSTADIHYYAGYPVREHPENISAEDANTKMNMFFAYGAHDGAVCKSREECEPIPTYWSYLHRQYKLSDF